VCLLTENWPHLGNGEKYSRGYYYSLKGSGGLNDVKIIDLG